ncbi:MAG: KEOPS complex N(6)-L-threonylcarbamoyladenine synthase Kae1 [Candidatus Pacearchaeota archaeon]|nr:KEOPS complex N(6)-L-threonylcarbamoyladenine synthase Kae1 [Candidatus Pacearchaeota archaeon]
MILGIESTAHTFGIALLEKKKFLCNLKSVYTTEKGGIIPIEAAKHHEAIKEKLLREALKKAKINLEDIKCIAYSHGPGLAPCLLQGLDLAKKIASKLKVPLVPVNHCIAHLEIGSTTGAKDPVLLYVSGANTQVIAYAEGKYRVFGETLDIGIGNFIDSFARYVGIGFPAGPKIEELAKKSKNFVMLPYTVKGMDVAFSGLLTNLKQKYDSGNYALEDLAFSLQEVAFAMLIEVAERAMAHLDKKELLLGGGVACNRRLQEMAKIMCKERKAKCFIPKAEFLVDNAAMIAWLGQKMFEAGIQVKANKADINPYERTDEVEVIWKS